MVKVLVVEDDPDAREDLEWAVRGPGREVVTAGSAREAIEQIILNKFHVVVTDLQMERPKAGLEILQAAKEKNVDTQVIVVTAFARPAISVDALRLGAADFLERNTPGTDFLSMLRARVNLALRDAEDPSKRAPLGKAAILGIPVERDDWPEVFVVMPFTAELKAVYDDHISRVISKLRLRIGRGDDVFGAGSIMKDIWSAIHAAQVVVADCTGRNANVFYEIGLAHAIGKDTILISQSLDDIPFDLRHLRIILYKYTPPGMDAFEKALKAAILQTGIIKSTQGRPSSAGAS